MTGDARHVWSILCSYAGASDTDSDWVQFRQWWDRFDGKPDEYRFMGSLGFGGKLYRDRQGMRVNYYREHETSERHAIIEATNAALARAAVDALENEA